MTFSDAINVLSEEQAFRATVSAMNTLLIAKGVYSAAEFEALFCAYAEAQQRGFQPAINAAETSRAGAVASL